MNKILLSLYIAIAPLMANAQFNPGSVAPYQFYPGLIGPSNYIANPVASPNAVTGKGAGLNATQDRDASTGYKLDGLSSWTCDTSAQNGYCSNTMIPVAKQADQDKTGNCQVTAFVKGDASLYSVRLMEGSTVLNTQLIGLNLADWKEFSFNYPCSGTLREVRIVQTEAGTSPKIYYGLKYGKATNVGGVSLPVSGGFAGASTFAEVNGTASGWTTLNDAIYASKTFPAGSPCAASGTANNYEMVCNLPAGSYHLNAASGLRSDGTSVCSARIYDGTTEIASNYQYNNTTGIPTGNLDGNVTYTSAVTKTFSVQYLRTNGSLCRHGGGSATGYFFTPSITVTQIDAKSQQVVRMDQSNYDWRAYTPTFTGFGTPSAIECQEKRDGSDNLIRCKFTSGTTTATEARISLPGSNVSADTTKIPSIQIAGTSIRSGSGADQIFPLIEPSVGYITFGNQSTSTAGLTKVNANGFTTTANLFSFNARVPIQGWQENQNAPLLVGGVTSSSTGLERSERVRFGDASHTNCTASPCAFVEQSGWLTNVTRTGTGVYVLNISAGTFSGEPTCNCNARGIAGSTNTSCSPNQSTDSATSKTLIVTNFSNATVDAYVEVTCQGPR